MVGSRKRYGLGMAGRTIVVHTTDLFLRSFLAVPPDRRDPAGRPVNALYGVARALARVVSRKQPDRAVAIVDAGTDPDHWPPPLRAQLPDLAGLLRVHGFVVVEADDALRAVAATTEQAVAAGHEVIVVGADKRLAQLVRPGVWWYEQHKDLFSTEEIVRKRFGVPPASIPDFLGLVGERDHLPGVPGIGKKSAVELIAEHGSLAGALEALDALPTRLHKALEKAGSRAQEEVARATLAGGTPPVSPEEGAYAVPDPEALNARYRALGFVALLHEAGHDEVEFELADPAKLASALEGWAGQPVAIAMVTDDPSPARGALVGVSLAGPDGPVRHVDLRAEVPQSLRAFSSDAAWPKVVHGASDLLVAAARRGIEVQGIHVDTAVASHLDDPIGRAPHDLEVVVRAVLGQALPPVEAVRGKGKSQRPFAALEAERVAEFAAPRARAVADLARRFGRPDDHHDLAMRLAQTLARMQQRGIACRAERLDEAEVWLLDRVRRLESEVHELVGRSFNLGSAKQLSAVLFDELGLEPPVRTRTGFSTATEVLARIEHAHPVVRLVMDWRQHRRLVDAWVTALRPAIDPDGRVRARQHLARSFSGRVLCSDPDLSRVPGRTEAMRWIRRAFAAPEGSVLLSIDYAQLGLVVLAHLSGDPRLVEPIESGADLHRVTAAAIFDVAADAVTPEQRQTAKAVNFATFNGQGPSALAAQLGVGVDEAKAFVQRFDDYYAVARAYQDDQLERARTTGEVRSWSGRRWRIRGLSSLEVRDRAYAERLARRAAIEGTVADITRLGLVEVDEALRAAGLRGYPLVQIHDEVLFEVPEGELDATVKVGCRTLEGVADLAVPLRVGAKSGPDWASLSPIE